MKNLNSLLVLVSMLLPVTVWAQAANPVKKYLNLYYKNSQLYVGLYKKDCVAGSSSEDEGTCVRSYEITSEQTVRSAFINATTDQWVSGTAKATMMQSNTLNLATDIDFGYTFENGKCSKNFEYLYFYGGTLNGQDHTISNLCSIDDGQTKRNLGLFGQITEKTVKNLNISNVHFVVTSGEPALTSGGDYRPVGALAPKISNSIVKDVKLKNVVIQAPLAGGLAGYIENSTIKNISTIDNSFIKISNKSQITDGYIGSEISGDYTNVFKPYKVLLGGLAGAAFFTNFVNVDLAVQVENKAAVDLSALGGLVGHYVYAPKEQVSDQNSKITKVNIHGSSGDVGVNALISGGTAMGGILGAARRLDENNSPIVELAISNSSVTNLNIKQSKIKIKDLDVTQNLYMGGIVGNANICNSGILKIKESTVDNINIEESIQEDAIFQYYMGGIAGYASCYHINNSGSREDLYLTLQKSTAEGNIKLTGGYKENGKATSHVRASAAIGGLVGEAILTFDENGISENESNVSIVYNAKRVQNDAVLDSVLVGGIFGAASISSGSGMDSVLLVKQSYLGSLDVDDDGISARVGGIVGKFPLLRSGNPKIIFHDVHAEGTSGKTLVVYSGESKASDNTSASIGGICGMCQSPKKISMSSIKGNFAGSSGNEAPPKKDFHLGGLIGTAVVDDALTVENNYFIGYVEKKFSKSEGKGKTGYLFGYLTGDGLGSKPKITSNFHYGNDNVGAIGFFSNYGEFANSVYLNDLEKFEAKSNVRNGAEIDLNDDGNGYVTDEYMKSRDLAVLLNNPWPEVGDKIWTFGPGGDFPFWGTPPMYTYTVRFLDADGNQLGETQEVGFGTTVVAPEAPKITGKCFDGWSLPFDKVMASMDVVATYKNGACKYPVAFYDLEGNLLEVKAEDGTTLSNPQEVEEGKSAIVPTNNPKPTADGKCFDGWKQDFSNITGELNVYPESKTCEYTVKFYDLRGFVIEDSEQKVLYGKAAVAPTDPLQKDDLCFIGWDTDFSEVKGNLEVKPNTKKCVFTVNFYGLDGTTIIRTQNVQEGLSARAPATPEPLGDLCFNGWDTDFSEVKGDLEVKANTKACPNSSSSSQQQPISSSSSETSSSSSVAQGNSSSSGTLTPNSSSSVSYIATITKPTAMQQDNALRMTFNDLQADEHAKVDYHIVVESKNGIYLDTVVRGKDVENIKNGTWLLDPAPAGTYTVVVTLTDGSESVRYDDFPVFKGDSVIPVNLASHSWQTYSLNAFCQDNGGDCKNELEALFARRHDSGAIDKCLQMKEELKRGEMDEYFREEMELVCQMAVGSDEVTSVFWWDESNPVGDYWQYRKFDVNQDFDSTRGYWYGPVDDEQLTFSLQTPNMNDEIVWKLKNNYSGWNLVANPYGWYVKLPQEDSVRFQKWNPEVSDYDPVDRLGPYEAVWVHTDKTRDYRIPLKAAIVLEDQWAPPPLLKSATSENWNLRVVLTDKNGKRDAWNELAVGNVASSLSEPPAGMGDRVNLSIVEGKRHLAKSVKKSGDDLEWNLEASATTTRDGKLSFVGLESVWAKGLHVYATIGDETVEVVKDSPINVKLSSKAKNVSIRVTKSAVPVQVAKNLISGFRVNQMQNALNIGFDAASKLAGAKVKVSVVGVDGRVVATSKSVANEGSNVVSVKKPKQGLYFVRLKVGSQTVTTRFLVH